MSRRRFVRAVTLLAVGLATILGFNGSFSAAGTARAAEPLSIAPVPGPPGAAMGEPTGGGTTPIDATYTHTCSAPCVDLPPGNGDVMTSTTIYYDFWLPTGQHYESNAAGDTNYENLLIQWAQDLGSSQFHNLVTQYYGNNGTISNNVTYGGSWTDTAAYPHAGTTADPLTDTDIQNEVHNAVANNGLGWTEDINHIVVVFVANGIQECDGSECTFTTPKNFCAYHKHFSDGGNDAIYAFMGFDNFTHVAGFTCVAGLTSGDTDPNRGNYPNGDQSADAEINTLSHEVIEAETDPHPNDTWTAASPEGEIGDACNFNFAPRNDTGADVYMNGHGYIMQQEYSNAAHTCAIDLPTNGFCAGSVSNVCSPTTSFTKTVDNANPKVQSTLHYTLTLNNTNNTGAETNLTLTDTLPAGYTVTGLSAPSSISSSSSSTSITVNYDTLPVHQSRTVTITASVPVQAGTPATNCGNLSGSDLIGTTLSAQTTSPCATTTPIKIPTIVTYTGPTNGDYHDVAMVSARLTDDSLNPLSGKTIHFTLNGTETCSGTTDGSGNASCPITPGEAAGPYTLKAAFTDASDPVYAVSDTNVGFTVTREETTTTYTGPTVIANGQPVTLTATVLEDGTTPPSPSVTATLSVDGQSCSGTSDPIGVVSCTIPLVSVPLGPQPLAAVFAGNAYYLPSSDTSKTATVFGFLQHGAFVLGNTTVALATPTTTVTWWASTWSTLNELTGGSPASFKGFAATTSTKPPACTATWTTKPGNSSKPPAAAAIPAYMGVIVSKSITKSGTTISGHIAQIVVVKTDPGYEPNPGHAGTGTIVANYC
jgi:uncharacterized repeat protein (TIGR01451 family)